jgi:hypothetical protein
VVIYTGDGLANGSGPLFSSDVGYINVTGDGTNFYGVRASASGLEVAVIALSASGYSVQGSYPLGTGWSDLRSIHYGDGYIVLCGALDGSWDLRLLKVGANLALTAITIDASPANSAYPSYFRNYYGSAPQGYVTPGYVNMQDGTVYAAPSGKTYLIVCAKGIGDVYEITSGPLPTPIPPHIDPVVVPPPPPVVPPPCECPPPPVCPSSPLVVNVPPVVAPPPPAPPPPVTPPVTPAINSPCPPRIVNGVTYCTAAKPCVRKRNVVNGQWYCSESP